MPRAKSSHFLAMDRRVGWGCLLITAIAAACFARYTEHIWEDYYITFRSSLNLVQGNGLVYQLGEKVHTFTSPLGVLLPALSAWVSGGESDLAALWIFRAMSIGALAGSVFLLVRIGQRWSLPWVPLLAAGLWLGSDGKTVDFTINGMETGFLLFFIVYALWAHTKGSANWRHQGAAWAGMMWTRPDCFIYVALIALGVLVFGNGVKREPTKTSIVNWLKAGGLTTALYLPWIIWAWVYYGTPVPHTVAAKSGLSDPFSFIALLTTAAKLPFSAAGYENSMGLAFLPAYCEIGGWHPGVMRFGKVLGGLAGIAWVLPLVSRRTRLVSFIFFGFHLYLSHFPYYYFPWYIPATAPFGILAITSLVADLWVGQKRHHRGWRIGLIGIVGCIILGNLLLTVRIAEQMKVQQELVENGVRRKIGEYLKAHAQPGDAVFMEPLGYIGYFSNLRTYDFPGMSSPEMVAARKLFGQGWLALIGYLRPEWVVLRPRELEIIQEGRNWFIPNSYELVTEFSQLERISQQDVSGLDYLKHDAVFQLYRRTHQIKQEADGMRSSSDFGVSERDHDGWKIVNAHAEAEVIFKIPEHARSFTLIYGFGEGAEKGETPTDGARFGFEIRDGVRIFPLAMKDMEPVLRERDRDQQEFSSELPDGLSAQAVLRVGIQSRYTNRSDWTYVSHPKFVITTE